MSPEEIKALTETLKMLSEMLEERPNEWLPLYAALGGAVAGAIASFIPTLLLEKRRDHRFAKQIQQCLLAEIAAFLEIIKRRRYLESVREVINHLKSCPKGTQASFTVHVPDHYSRVYQENCRHIGVVEREVARRIVVFHQLVDAVVQDVRPGGMVSEGASIHAFEEMEAILIQAIEVAKSLDDRT